MKEKLILMNRGHSNELRSKNSLRSSRSVGGEIVNRIMVADDLIDNNYDSEYIIVERNYFI